MQYLSEKEDGTEIETEGEEAVFAALCDARESLETLLYQYHSLYDRWSEERQTALKWHSELAKQTQLLAEEAKRLRALNAALPNSFVSAIQDTTQHSMTLLKELSIKAANEHMGDTVKLFNNLFTQAGHQLRDYQEETKKTVWYILIAIILSSVLTASLMAKFMRPKPQSILTSHQIYDLYQGSMLTTIWPKLTEKEQKRIETLMNEQMRVDKTLEK